MTNQTRVVEVELEGLAGAVRITSEDVSLHGKWASHTGFRSHAGMLASDLSDEELRKIAAEHYKESMDYAFAVGDEHREHGWKKICMDYKKRIQIRLPDWHEGIVSATLERYGMVNTCKNNHYWTFEADSRVSMQTARAVLEPILRPGTRFACEQQMSDAIDICAITNGYLARTPLFSGAMQAELF